MTLIQAQHQRTVWSASRQERRVFNPRLVDDVLNGCGWHYGLYFRCVGGLLACFNRLPAGSAIKDSLTTAVAFCFALTGWQTGQSN
jgi:hypothetical protein